MNIQKLIEKANEKNLIFTVTPGRSGTTLLTRLLGILPDTAAFHEEYPGYDHVLRYVQTNPLVAKQFFLTHKLPHIIGRDESNYVETSHLICKGFIETFINLGLAFKLVDLRRSPSEVAMSMYGYNSIPGRTNDGLSHYLYPEDPGILPLPHWTTLHDYQLCFWHSLEIERRQRCYTRWMERVGAITYTIKMHELVDYDRYISLCERLGYSDMTQNTDNEKKYQEIIRVNQNPKKKFRAIDFDRAKLEAQVIDLISNYDPFLWSDVRGFYGTGK